MCLWLQHFQQRCDADMVAELAARPVGMGNLSLKERIAYAVQTRLRMIVPYIGARVGVCSPGHVVSSRADPLC